MSKTKFQAGQAVVLSNPATIRNRYKGQEGIVSDFISCSDGRPYHVKLTTGEYLWVNVKELSAIDTENVQLLQTGKTKQVVQELDFNALAFQQQNFKVGDKVKIAFVPEPENYKLFSTSRRVQYVAEKENRHFHNRVGETGTIRYVNSDNTYGVYYDESTCGGWDVYPALCLRAIKEEVNRNQKFYEFQGSRDRKVVLYADRILIGDEIYSFDLFERLQTEIEDYKKNPRPKKISLEHRWVGEFNPDFLQVGCQQFHYSSIRRLVAAIRKVKTAVAK